MKFNSTVWLVFALCCAVLSNGCGKKGDQAGAPKEPKISGSPSDPPVSLVPKWQAGQRYVMRMESAQTMEMPDFAAGRGAQADGKTATVENNFAQEYSFSVTNAPDGNQGLEMEILAIELQAGRGNQMINYDSRNTVAREGGPFADAFDQVVGGKLWCLVSPENKVLKVEGVDELFARAEAPPPADAQPAGRRAANRGAATGVLRGMYNEEVIKQMIEFSSGMPKTLRIGESWTINREMPQPVVGTLLLSVTNTFRGWQEHDGKKCARVEFAGTISTKEGDAGDGGAGMASVTIHDGVIKGHYWYSPDILIPVETSIEQNYTVNASGAGNAGGRNAGNVSFTAPTKQNVSMRLLEVKSATAP
ncbi:MAG TPA: DUF6263 family protein [Methylomirabilota bacterium]|nr:DUF6263 family protein [Methylomirabilota bacterium]